MPRRPPSSRAPIHRALAPLPSVSLHVRCNSVLATTSTLLLFALASMSCRMYFPLSLLFPSVSSRADHVLFAFLASAVPRSRRPRRTQPPPRFSHPCPLCSCSPLSMLTFFLPIFRPFALHPLLVRSLSRCKPQPLAFGDVRWVVGLFPTPFLHAWVCRWLTHMHRSLDSGRVLRLGTTVVVSPPSFPLPPLATFTLHV